MIDVNDADWELISAYADGELPEAEALAVQERLTREPELRAALEQVQMVSGALAQMRPEPPAAFADPTPMNSRTPPANRNWRPLAACVSLAAALAVSMVMFLHAPSDNPLDLHMAFSSNSYVLPDGESLREAAIGSHPLAPDLGIANLYLVDLRELSGGRISAHYSGRNNCRLTLVSGPVPETTDAPSDTHVQDWSTGGRHFTLLATGMDRRRFDAIAAFLRQAVLSPAQPGSVLAMKQATDAAAPCLTV